MVKRFHLHALFNFKAKANFMMLDNDYNNGDRLSLIQVPSLKGEAGQV